MEFPRALLTLPQKSRLHLLKIRPRGYGGVMDRGEQVSEAWAYSKTNSTLSINK